MGLINRSGTRGPGLAALIAVVGALALTACGSDGGGEDSTEAESASQEPEVTRAEFAKAADKVCESGARVVFKRTNRLLRKNGIEPVKFGENTTRELTHDVSADYSRISVAGNTRSVNLIGRLEVPPKYADLVNQYLEMTTGLAEQYRRRAKLYDEAFRAAENGDSTKEDELLARDEGILAGITKEAKRRAKAMKPIGFKECAQ